MTFEASCQKEFDAVVRARGEADFHGRLVQLRLRAKEAAQFLVSGETREKDQATVSLDWSQAVSDGHLRARCTCLPFQAGEPCRHIWAALLELGQVAEYLDLPYAERLTLEPLEHPAALEVLRDAIDVQASLSWPVNRLKPKALARFTADTDTSSDAFRVELSFLYDGIEIDIRSREKVLLNPSKEIRIKRHLSAEKELMRTFKGELSLENLKSNPSLPASKVQSLTSQLLENGWSVEVERKPVHSLSGVESLLAKHEGHFVFAAVFHFGGERIPLRSVLEASSADERFIHLENGGLAFLPEEWTKRLELLACVAKRTKEGFLGLNHASLPLAQPILSEIPGLQTDPESRDALSSFIDLSDTGPAVAPQGLKAQLRSYQSEGLFWLNKMAERGFGGILADDMGLGKTVQVIAYLLHRSHRSHPGQGPSLVVLPKSLVFNWLAEIEKFGPRLRVLDFAGPTRGMLRALDYDVVVTTYHVLKNEIDRFEKFEFDSIILDEAQAIKNPGSQIAQAVARLRGRHRFALSGTPVENSLNDLFSLMRFTNPGLIPQSLIRAMSPGRDVSIPKSTLESLSVAVSPFILRRTKKQVLTELPDKCEQTLMCELEGTQKHLYEKLRKQFRSSLTKEVRENGLGKSQMRVFEALLRLRQASCHPGLVDKSLEEQSGAKFDTLLEHLQKIHLSSHKALVFSQFTSFLELLKPRLQKARIRFEYLDGQTRNRGAVVDRFNSDAETTVFLISLKAGGTGLNLTTASYVFLLDPWWNPAIEAQAIDRAYRMGQKQKVMAYRLIAQGTIEEKIMRLQERKKSLAEAVIHEDRSFLRTLTTEDLASLLD